MVTGIEKGPILTPVHRDGDQRGLRDVFTLFPLNHSLLREGAFPTSARLQNDRSISNAGPRDKQSLILLRLYKVFRLPDISLLSSRKLQHRWIRIVCVDLEITRNKRFDHSLRLVPCPHSRRDIASLCLHPARRQQHNKEENRK